MGANAKEYLRFQMFEADYKNLSNETRSKMELLSVKVINPKYKDNPKWVEANKTASKSYAKLKDIEYEINNNK
jgi:hypothetical protein